MDYNLDRLITEIPVSLSLLLNKGSSLLTDKSIDHDLPY